MQELHDVAVLNIQKHPPSLGRAISICCDATEYEFPANPLIVYASNPFSERLMSRVLQNLARHRQTKWFVHENAVYSLSALPAGGPLTLVQSDSACCVYSWR